MPHRLATELFASLKNLEDAIAETKKTVAQRTPNRSDIAQRLACYEDVLSKQKVLANTLLKHIKDENWDQVRRYVELIRGSSVLIQLDSQSIIDSLDPTIVESEKVKFND